jgi:hypothetical protein
MGNKLNRKEAVALFTELVAQGYVQPNLVIVEQRKLDKYQLKIKGNYDRSQIELFLKNTMFSIEENKNYLIIFKH